MYVHVRVCEIKKCDSDYEEIPIATTVPSTTSYRACTLLLYVSIIESVDSISRDERDFL